MEARLNLLVIRSANIDAAASFYALLGLQFAHHAHGTGPLHYACEREGFTFEIYPLREGDAPTTSARIGFQVESLDDTLKGLLAAGGKLVSSPKQSDWGYRAVIEDIDGHRVELCSIPRKAGTMSEPRIVDRGDGPKIEGTRITVYTVLEYLRHGYSRDWMAAFFRLSSRQIQAAIDYIRENESAVNAEFEKIMARIAKGNPPEVLAKLAANHELVKAKMAEFKARREQAAR